MTRSETPGSDPRAARAPTGRHSFLAAAEISHGSLLAQRYVSARIAGTMGDDSTSADAPSRAEPRASNSPQPKKLDANRDQWALCCDPAELTPQAIAERPIWRTLPLLIVWIGPACLMMSIMRSFPGWVGMTALAAFALLQMVSRRWVHRRHPLDQSRLRRFGWGFMGWYIVVVFLILILDHGRFFIDKGDLSFRLQSAAIAFAVLMVGIVPGLIVVGLTDHKSKEKVSAMIAAAIKRGALPNPQTALSVDPPSQA